MSVSGDLSGKYEDDGSPHESKLPSVHASLPRGSEGSQQRPAGVWAGLAKRDLSAIYFLNSGINSVLQASSYDTFFFPMLILRLEGKN